MKINNAELTQLTECCFDLAMDGRVQPADRKEFLSIGKRFRGSLLNLLTAQFAEGTQAVIEANTKIKTMNTSLSNSTQVLKNTAQVIGQLRQLVSILDDLLKIASAFL
jgi:hypothetical protein